MAQLRETARDPLEDSEPDRRILDDTAPAYLVATGLELWFHERDESRQRGATHERGQHLRQRDERQVSSDEPRRLAHVFRTEIASVRPIHPRDAGVLLKGPDELSMAHVDGDDVGGAAL